MWCLSAYPQGIQYVGDFASSVEHKLRFITHTVAVCESYNSLLCGDVLKWRLVSYCIASLVSVERLLGHFLWLTGKCVQLNWSSILLDGYKKRSLLRQPSCEALLLRRPKSVKTIDSTMWLHRTRTLSKDISIAFYLSSFLQLVSLLFFCSFVFITNSYYV